MSAELRERLGLLATEELVGILERLDAEKRRPEVFPVVEGILRERGVDVTGIAGRRREPKPSPHRVSRLARILSHWKRLALASLLGGRKEVERVRGELGERLGRRSTEELIDILERFDLEQWRPEAFPMVESILQTRGIDVTCMPGRRQAPPSPEPRPSRTLNHWEGFALAALITFVSGAVGIPIVAFLGLYVGFSAFATGPSPFALPMALSAWWVAMVAILSGLKRVSRLPYVSEAFAAAMVFGQAAVFAVPLVLPRLSPVFSRHDYLISFGVGGLIAFVFVARAGRGSARS